MLNPLEQMILEEFDERREQFEQILEDVKTLLIEKVHELGLSDILIEGRVKTRASLEGKLVRKSGKYHSLDDLTDIVGLRIITLYNEDVDRLASILEEMFTIDWANSVDKRKTHELSQFGYNSLHYICYRSSIRFEVQIRTQLQHVWSAIQHDIGYKSEVEIPLQYHRDFGRLAGVLELADIEFSRIRREVTDYRRHMHQLLHDGRFEDIELNSDTWTDYVGLGTFDKLNRQIADINQAEIVDVSLVSLLGVLRSLGFATIADVDAMLRSCSDDAYKLARHLLGNTDLDIISSTVGLQYLCIVRELRRGASESEMRTLLDLWYGTASDNSREASDILLLGERLGIRRPPLTPPV